MGKAVGKAALCRAWLIPALVGLAGPAAAHGPGLPIGPAELWHHWTFDPLTLAPLLIIHALYGRGLFQLWRRAGLGVGIGIGRVCLFLTGEVALVIALVSPLDAVGETLLSAHMLQHAVLVVVAPPLLIAGRPDVAVARALPLWAQRGLARLLRGTRAWRGPVAATMLHGATLWIWHVPALFVAALNDPLVHWLEHVMFFATAMLFFASVGAGRTGAAAGTVVLMALISLIHMGMLGAVLTLAPAPLYPWYEGRAAAWGMDALTDQQLAGLIMWAPMSAAYVIVAGVALTRLVSLRGPEPFPPTGVSDPSRARRLADDRDDAKLLAGVLADGNRGTAGGTAAAGLRAGE